MANDNSRNPPQLEVGSVVKFNAKKRNKAIDYQGTVSSYKPETSGFIINNITQVIEAAESNVGNPTNTQNMNVGEASSSSTMLADDGQRGSARNRDSTTDTQDCEVLFPAPNSPTTTNTKVYVPIPNVDFHSSTPVLVASPRRIPKLKLARKLSHQLPSLYPIRRNLLLIQFRASPQDKFWCRIFSEETPAETSILIEQVSLVNEPPAESETANKLFYAMMGKIVVICGGLDCCRLLLYNATTLIEEDSVSLGNFKHRCAGVIGNTVYVFGRSESDKRMLKIFDVRNRNVTEHIFPNQSGYEFGVSRSSQSRGLEICFTRSNHVAIYNTVSGLGRCIVLPTPRAPRQWYDAATCVFNGVLIFHNHNHGLTWYDESNSQWTPVEGFSLARVRRLTTVGLGISENRLLMVWSVRGLLELDSLWFCRVALERTQTGGLMGVLVDPPLRVATIKEGYKISSSLSLAH